MKMNNREPKKPRTGSTPNQMIRMSDGLRTICGTKYITEHGLSKEQILESLSQKKITKRAEKNP